MPDAPPISSRKNPVIRGLRDLREAPGRAAAGVYLIEGLRPVEAALAAGAPLAAAYTSPRLARGPRGAALARALADAGVPVTALTDDALGAAATTRTHQGVLATCRPWPARALPGGAPPWDLVVLGDLQDPGNLGTIWRSAAACGAGLLVQGAGGVDPYSPKVIRAAAGADAVLPAQRQAVDPGTLRGLRAAGWQLVAAAGGADLGFDAVEWGPRVAFVIGREGPGLPESWVAECDVVTRIPMAPGVESLNAAVSASVLLYERARRGGFATLRGGTGPAGAGSRTDSRV